MKEFTYTLLTDGSSDKVLIPIINWILDQINDVRYVPQFAELTLRPSVGLRERARRAMEVYECDILVIHRDGEAVPYDDRLLEIERSVDGFDKPYVPLIPIRMSEAWLLLDEQAIRAAASNPNGKVKLNVPPIGSLEAIADPKQRLFDLLRQASELPPRRLQKFRPDTCRHRIADLTENFEQLRQVSAFRQFEEKLIRAVETL